MKKIKWSNILIAICYIVGGIMFFIDEKLTKEIICTWIGYGLLIIGSIKIISYFVHPKHESFLKHEFGDGLMYITVGLLPLFEKEVFVGVVYLVLAIMIMMSGYQKLQDGVDAWRFGYKHNGLYFVLAAISIIIGLIVISNAEMVEKTMHYLIGAGLLYSGISDLVSSIFISSRMFIYERNLNRVESEKDIEDVEEENTPEA